ncbi:hypothetical protein EIN_185840 [Entamoeba invadens IP1]|uniref:hypothetical protein n=1 Tax=Entamoeba invadens IP1 TaxID=370355 RepID=UPI0002C3E69A|nr:hypothetical protein EIN_185840 [Entamoeba invadens IP1]ELP94177.1 hypothetical protein EIN_185840 [Entamoeba invadens IP1]|eukprot:XP_004260948.1 hypothetical protein EIN_185840 [Entamoeba invadens IP1]
MGYEYLDHPADVILHSWGADINGALISAVEGMFNFMSDLTRVEEKDKRVVQVNAKSYEELLVKLLDGWLCIFSSELFLAKRFVFTQFDDSDEDNITITCEGFGEFFVVGKHQQGTEIKAITWHNLEIYDDVKEQTHIHILLDI